MNKENLRSRVLELQEQKKLLEEQQKAVQKEIIKEKLKGLEQLDLEELYLTEEELNILEEYLTEYGKEDTFLKIFTQCSMFFGYGEDSQRYEGNSRILIIKLGDNYAISEVTNTEQQYGYETYARTNENYEFTIRNQIEAIEDEDVIHIGDVYVDLSEEVSVYDVKKNKWIDIDEKNKELISLPTTSINIDKLFTKTKDKVQEEASNETNEYASNIMQYATKKQQLNEQNQKAQQLYQEYESLIPNGQVQK